jgi:hypothetical protein
MDFAEFPFHALRCIRARERAEAARDPDPLLDLGRSLRPEGKPLRSAPPGRIAAARTVVVGDQDLTSPSDRAAWQAPTIARAL